MSFSLGVPAAPGLERTLIVMGNASSDKSFSVTIKSKSQDLVSLRQQFFLEIKEIVLM